MIQKAILVLFTLYIGMSLSVLGGARRYRIVSQVQPHHLDLAHMQVHHQLFHLHQQFHHQLFHLQESLHSPHGFVPISPGTESAAHPLKASYMADGPVG